MSKIKTNYIEPRVSDSTVTIGTKDGHVRIIGKSVEIDGHPNDIQIGNLLEGYESLYIYITKDEFRNNSNKFFISDVEPSDHPDLNYPAKPGDAWLNNELKDWRVYSIKGDVGAWRSPQIQEDVYKLKEDVISLQGEIESIIKTDEKGVWSPSVNDPPQSGEVQFSSNDFTSPSMIIKVSKTDKDGLAHLFTTANVGEWMEFIEDDADYMLGQIRELDNEDDEFFQATLDVSVGQGTVHYEAGSTMKVRLFEAVDDFDPASIRIVDIAIAPPEKPNNGDLWFDNNSSDMQLRVYQHDSEAWIAAAPATTVEDRVAQGEQLQLQIKNEVLKLRSDFEAMSASVSQESPILWKYNPLVSEENLGNGEFRISVDPVSGSADEWTIYFGNRDARGQRWFPHDSGNSYSHAVEPQFATIRDRDSIVCHGKTKKWYFNEGNNNYVKLVLTYYRNQFSMANGKYYLITIPGYMPFFPYSSNAYSNGTH